MRATATRPNRACRLLVSTSIVAAAATLASAPARAQEWRNTLGNWNTPANWSPILPTATDDATIISGNVIIPLGTTETVNSVSVEVLSDLAVLGTLNGDVTLDNSTILLRGRLNGDLTVLSTYAPLSQIEGWERHGAVSRIRRPPMTDIAMPKSKRTRRFARMPNSDAKPGTNGSEQSADAATAPTAEPPTKPESRTARIVTLMQREQGATLNEMIAATGWLPHTTRAALTGLKKKGHGIQRSAIDGVSHYTITAAA